MSLSTLPSDLFGLPALRSLRLSSNGLTALPAEIARLTNLSFLYLDDNRLTALPAEIGRLTALRFLVLDGNKLKKLPAEIVRLTTLWSLYLGRNALTALPAEIGRLTALGTLYLNDNGLKSLPAEIGRLTALETLSLGSNGLKSLPAEIGRLTALQTLDLDGNGLKSLPAEIGRLTALQTLDLGGNGLESLPAEIEQLPALAALYLHGNPGLGLPAEVLGPTWSEVYESKGTKKPRPPKEILAYYFRIHPPPKSRGEGKSVREGRVIVIGDGGAGKTSLVRAILDGEPARESEETTRTVVVRDWDGLKLVNPATGRANGVSVHFWDFGGQEPMHAAHPYFFTNRTLYLVVATSRDVGVEERIAYWLRMVAAHGRGARALVAVNQVDQHPMDIKERELCAAHQDTLPADPARAFYPTSCKPGKMEGIEELGDAMKRELGAMEQMWALVPPEWMATKAELERQREQGQDTLSFEDWARLCEENRVPAEERDEALQLLRDLGTVVSFPDDHHLSALGVLNPSWVTQAIYPLLTSHELAAAHGLLEPKDLGRLLNDTKRYPPHKHGWLIELMKKFELVFENEGRLLLPARLPKDAPDWALDPGWKAEGTVQLELRFDVLPESVISKFITRWHERAWRPESWWRHGIAVKDRSGRCAALLRAHVGDAGRIEINIQGPGVARLGFIAALRDDLETLCQKLQRELWLKLGGIYPRKYDDLLILAYKGNKRTITEVVEGEVMEFDLVEALGLVETEPHQKESLVNLTVVGRDAMGNAFGRESKMINKSSFGDLSHEPRG